MYLLIFCSVIALSEMDHFMFECLTKGKQINKAASQQGWQYTSLREYTVNDNGNAIPTKSYRCAVSILYMCVIIYSI